MKITSLLLILTLGLLSCGSKNGNETMTTIVGEQAPLAKKIPHSMDIHGDTRLDNYYWMRLSDEQKMASSPDDQTKDVVAYLDSENAYREKAMEHTKGLQEGLYQEIIARIKQTDESVPYLNNGYWYLQRFEAGKEYATHFRKKGSMDAVDELLIDENNRAAAHDYYQLGAMSISPDNKIMAYSEDTLSRRIYSARFKSLTDGSDFDDVISKCTGGIVWANDNKTVFYTIQDESLRPYKVFRHVLGTPSSQDVEVYHEKDETFVTSVSKSRSKKYIIIGSYTTVSAEFRILNADTPSEAPALFQARERDHEFSINHANGKWYIHTNKDGATNFKLMVAEEGATQKENWKDVIPHRPDILLEGFLLFKDFVALNERVKGITQIRIYPWNEGKDHYIKFAEDAFTSSFSTNADVESRIVRVNYTSLKTPTTTFDYSVDEQKLTLLKQQEIVGGFNPDDYETERVYVKARDGVEVPMSIVYKKGFVKDGSKPLLLYGYGSYGYSIDPTFNSARLSLLDRGFAYAIAHIRGGEDLGRVWYDSGKKLKKKNTFTDFIDCGQYLVDQKYTSPNGMFAMGGSAGGLLMGSVINMAPQLWKGVVAAVPFVDVVTTMLDETIPLTTGEYDEWGNPNEKEYYEYMKSYSPYDNVTAQDYPAMLVTTGYHDSQVQYWEPAKWVAKLRELKTDNNPLYMYCNMEVGHGGASGRFARYKETAMEFAFILDQSGIKR